MSQQEPIALVHQRELDANQALKTVYSFLRSEFRQAARRNPSRRSSGMDRTCNVCYSNTLC
jgi:hypothetical protein